MTGWAQGVKKAPFPNRKGTLIAYFFGMGGRTVITGHGAARTTSWATDPNSRRSNPVALIAYMYSLVIVAMIVNQFAENRTLKRQEKARLSGSAQARLRESPPSGEGD